MPSQPTTAPMDSVIANLVLLVDLLGRHGKRLPHDVVADAAFDEAALRVERWSEAA